MPVSALAADDLGIQSLVVDYLVNDVPQTPVTMTLEGGTLNSYKANVPLPALSASDQIKYRITATDVAVAQNKTYSPGASTYHLVSVTEIGAARDFYSNDFNSASDDLFGTGFSITTPTGFSNGAIHSTHPYIDGPEAQNFENFSTYQLKFPIRINPSNPTVRFDEIVLVEPGEEGTQFGDPTFWDYVVVEGSKDFGATWSPFFDGYDARARPEWLQRWNSSGSGNNSTATGDPTLYRTRQFSLLESGDFQFNDEVMIRFVLFADELANGWGWAIDNLKIQVDDVGPRILHDHVDYFAPGTATFPVAVKATDNSGVDKVFLDYSVGSGAVTTIDLPSGSPGSYAHTIDLSALGLTVGSVLNYRIRATDTKANTASIPASGFMKVPVFTFGTAPMTSYVSDFNATNSDFIGNFFSIGTVTGFSDGILHSDNYYPVGFGYTTETSSFTYYLKQPITVDAANPYVLFDEVALVEGHDAGTPFGTPAFKDYVILEGSKNGGSTWLPVLDGYDSELHATWKNAFNQSIAGMSGQFKPRKFKLTDNGNFAAGDNVLLRFRLFSNESVNGWGWAIDNLSIQGPITGIEESPASQEVLVYPNPVTGKQTVHLSVACESSQTVGVRLVSSQGRILESFSEVTADSRYERDLPISHLPAGLYIVSVNLGGRTFSKKFLKQD
jgi:hypothetical protein